MTGVRALPTLEGYRFGRLISGRSLKLRREQQETDRLAAGVEFWEDWGLVFTTRFGTPLSPRNDYRDFQRLVGAAGLRFGCTTCGTPLLRLCWPRK